MQAEVRTFAEPFEFPFLKSLILGVDSNHSFQFQPAFCSITRSISPGFWWFSRKIRIPGSGNGSYPQINPSLRVFPDGAQGVVLEALKDQLSFVQMNL